MSSYDLKKVINKLIKELHGYYTEYYREFFKKSQEFYNFFTEHEGLYFCGESFTNGRETKDYYILKASYLYHYEDMEFVKEYLKSVDK